MRRVEAGMVIPSMDLSFRVWVRRCGEEEGDWEVAAGCLSEAASLGVS